MLTPRCPICDRPLNRVDYLLAQRDAHFECRFCWNRIHMNGSGNAPMRARSRHKKMHTTPARGRK